MSAKEWPFAEAKRNLDEVVNRALADGPQWVRSREGRVVVLSQQEYLDLGSEAGSCEVSVHDQRELESGESEDEDAPNSR